MNKAMISPWWSLLPIILFAVFYLLFLRLLRFRIRRRRGIRMRRFLEIRRTIRREGMEGEELMRFLCAELPAAALAIFNITDNYAERLAEKETTPDPAARKALGELEIGLPALTRHMRRHGIAFARLENTREKIAREAPDEPATDPEFSAYILRLPRESRFLAALVRNARDLPDLDQLSRFAAFLNRRPRRETREQEHPGDESVHRLEAENRNLRKELHTRENSLLRIMHDIRLPLSGLMLNHEVLEKRTASRGYEDLLRPLRLMKNQLNTLESFTHDVLQLETGHWLGAEAPNAAEPDRIIAEVLEACGESLRLKSIQTRFDPGAGGAAALPGAALERILYNLISNSIKFCSSPGRLDIASRRRDGFLTVEIEDSGPGLPSSEDTLFELARRNIGRGGRGWGLGLASAMDLAEKLGGKLVLIPPKIASGANFLLVLPA